MIPRQLYCVTYSITYGRGDFRETDDGESRFYYADSPKKALSLFRRDPALKEELVFRVYPAITAIIYRVPRSPKEPLENIVGRCRFTRRGAD